MILVLPSNDPPRATEDSYVVPQGDVLDIVPAAGVLANDTDPDGDSLTARMFRNPIVGNIKFNSDGSFSYGAGLDFAGEVTFTYVANDGTGDSEETLVTVTVNPTGGEGEAEATPNVLDQVMADENDWLTG